jgi:hypothetical protein
MNLLVKFILAFIRFLTLHNFITLLFNFIKIKMLKLFNNLKVFSLNKFNKIKNITSKYLPFKAFKYIYNKPMFIKLAILYVFNNINVSSIYTRLSNLVLYIFNNCTELLNLSFYYYEYLDFVNYINFCFEINKFISFEVYIEYIEGIQWLEGQVVNLRELINEKRNMALRFNNMQSDNIFVVGGQFLPKTVLFQISNEFRVAMQRTHTFERV